MTKEQYEKLKQWEGVLNNAVKNSFVHLPFSEFEKIAAIYAEVFGTPLRKGQMNCNTCRLNALKKLGEAFLAFNKPEKEKSNRGRPKKIKEE